MYELPEPIVRDDGWVYVRDAPTQRIIEGVMTCEILDLQGDVIEVDAVVARMPWIALHAPLLYKHGHDRSRGACPLGEMVAWKHDQANKQILVRDYIKEGSPLVDDIYRNEIQPIGTRAGFSIGGAVLDKTCWVEKGRLVCLCHDTDVVEHSWTPKPANPRTYLNYVSVAASLAKQRQLLAMAKGMMHKKVEEMKGTDKDDDPMKTEEEKGDGDDADKKDPNSGESISQMGQQAAGAAMLLLSQDEVTAKEADLNIRLKGTYAHYPIPVKAGDAVLKGCGVCDDLATLLVVGKGASVASALKELQVRLDSAQGEALRIAKELEDKKNMNPVKKEGEGAAPPAQGGGGAAPAQGQSEEAKGIQAILAKLAELEQRIAACEGKAGPAPGPGAGVGAPAGAPTGKSVSVGTGEKPKPGGSEGSETPDDIDRKTMSTTKDQQLAVALKMVTDSGYTIQGVTKARPDAMPTTPQGYPGGINPTEKTTDEDDGTIPPAFKRAMARTRTLAHPPQGGSA